MDTADVLAALESGKVAAYATDFASKELIGAKGVLVTPHLGASTPESEDNCARMAARELMDYLENGNIRNSVNMPAVSMPREGTRICDPAQECTQHHQPFLRRGSKGRAQYREYVQQVQKRLCLHHFRRYRRRHGADRGGHLLLGGCHPGTRY